MTKNTQSIVGKRFPDWDDEMMAHGPGAFCWKEGEAWHGRVLLFILPGETEARHIHVNKGGMMGDQVWGWDGNEDCPTIIPSIQAWDRKTGTRLEHWHGWLTAGEFKSC